MKTWFANLQFRYKILLVMCSLTTLSIILISCFSLRISYTRNMNDALDKANDSTRLAADLTKDRLDSLLLNSSRLLSAAPFDSLLSELWQGQEVSYTQYFASTSSQLSTFLENNPTLDGAYLCAPNGAFFSVPYAGTYRDPTALFPENLWNVDTIQLFNSRYDSLTNSGNVLPLVLPVQRMVHFWSFSGTHPELAIRFVLMLDAKSFRTVFTNDSNAYTYQFYLADSAGTPLDIAPEDCAEAFDAPLLAFVENSQELSQTALELNGETYYVNVRPIGLLGLKAVHLIQNRTLLSYQAVLLSSYFVVWLICIVLCGVLCLYLSDFLVRPLRGLIETVQQIKDGTYLQRRQFRYQDEIGVLGTQLNAMYDTIQLQIEQITLEEKEKAQAEIRMLSEQVNPHFLYNTLECIHLQVLTGHSANAVSMLESLGKYLRLTLSSGDAKVTIDKEMAHATEYIALINRGADCNIEFSCQSDPSLREHKILKMLLQPLVENCIKHGFDPAHYTRETEIPRIEVDISRQAQLIQIAVTDNGIGIDIPRAQACLSINSQEGARHFGLNNIYRRLCSAYGQNNITVSFSSIPHYQNTITLLFPYEES